MNYLRFDHQEMLASLYKAMPKRVLVASAALVFTACTTTQPTRPPIVNEPVVKDVVKDKDEPVKEVQVEDKDDEVIKDEEEDFESEYVNNRDGVTLPHMKGRDIKRLALLLPFSSRSTRLREEAASMMKARSRS